MGAAAYPITVIVVVAIIIGIVFLLRFGLRQDRRVRDVRAKPGASKKLAITALVVAFIVPPVGALLGHVALYRIGTGVARGRQIAENALFIGYGLWVLEMLTYVVLYPGLRWFE